MNYRLTAFRMAGALKESNDLLYLAAKVLGPCELSHRMEQRRATNGDILREKFPHCIPVNPHETVNKPSKSDGKAGN